MFDRIDQIIKLRGYQNIPLKVSGIYFYLFQQEEEGYAVVLIDETAKRLLTREQFLQISQQFREYLMKRDCRSTTFLYLLLSNDTNSAGRLFQEEHCYWEIQPLTRQFRVYENWNPFYSPLRKDLEQLFSPAGPGTAATEHTQKKHHPSPQALSKSSVRESFLSCTFALVLINVIIFLITTFLSLRMPNVDWLGKGSESWTHIVYGKEYYRLLTHMFLHLNWDHIFHNMICLFFVGNQLEKQIGHIRFLIIYFSSGILAGGTSIVYNMIQNEFVTSVGASGALFGIMGALLLVNFFRKDMSKRDMTFTVILLLFLGTSGVGVNYVAHIGGFLWGMLISALLLIPFERRGTQT